MSVDKVKILSIVPDDQFNLAGHVGNIIKETVEVGKSLIVSFENGRLLRTSRISEISKTKTTIEVNTMNSKYTLEYIRESNNTNKSKGEI